jgi:hypothetical protein
MANSTLAALGAASALGGTELIYGTQSGVDKKITASQVKTFAIGSGSVSVASGKTLTSSNTLTFAGTDGISIALGAGGTVLYSGDALGTPSSATLTHATGLPLSTGISGNLSINNLNSGIGASNTTFWRGDGTWAAPTVSLTVGTSSIAGGTTGRVLYDNGGLVGEMTTTGSGTVLALATSPTFVTPTLGVASATSLNKVTLTAPASGSTLTIADGKTLTASNTLSLAGTDGKTLTVSNSLTLAGTDSTTMTFPPASASIGYLGVPQNSQTAAYTTVLADSGKHILHPSSDNNPRTFTIDSNANVAYPVGTVLTFINMINTVTIAITSDTLTLLGAGSTGSRTLAVNGIATAVKIASTSWVISGTNLT